MTSAMSDSESEPPPEEEQQQLDSSVCESEPSTYATRLYAASASGDVDAVLALLAEDDGDGWVHIEITGEIDASLSLHCAAQAGYADICGAISGLRCRR